MTQNAVHAAGPNPDESLPESSEKNRPLLRIVLTRVGDTLLEHIPEDGTRTHGYDEMQGTLGLHEHCGHWIHRRKATATHHVLVCDLCNLRVPFPKSIKIYRDLDAWLGENRT